MKIKHAMTWFAVAGALAAGVTLVVADHRTAPGPTPTAAPSFPTQARAEHRAPAHKRATPGDEGGGFDTRPRLTQASVFSGTTNVGRSPEIEFLARNVSSESIAAVAEQLRTHAMFVDAGGHWIAASARTERSLGTTYSHAITLAPAQALAADTWYTLIIERDPALVVGGPEDMLDDPDLAKQVRMFTGSAPQIRRLSRGSDRKKPSQLEIVMSEPVVLGELVRQGFAVQLAGQPLAGCITWDAGCVSPDATARTAAFSFVPSTPLHAPRPVAITVAMSAGVRGDGRSVAEGAALTHLALDASTGAHRHVVAVAAADWGLCSDTGDVQCWRSTP